MKIDVAEEERLLIGCVTAYLRTLPNALGTLHLTTCWTIAL